MFAYLPFVPGNTAGVAVVTDQFLCLLGPSTPSDAARDLFSLLATSTAGFDDVLDAVAVRHQLEDFAIVELRDAVARSVNVAVRGSISIDFGGSSTTRLSGSAGATWITGEARGITTLQLGIHGLADAAESMTRLPIARGVVSTAAIMLDVSADGPAEPATSAPLSTETVPVPLPRLKRKPAATSPATSANRRRPAPEEKAPVKKAPVKKAPEKKAPVPQERQPAPDSRQPARIDLSSLAVTAEEARLRLRLPDGNELDAMVPVVLGRRPWSAEFDTESSFHVSVPSPRREVSGTHLELAEVDGQLVARDLDSTNGTIVVSQSRPPRLLDRGRTTELSLGDVLDIGEGFAIEVVGGSGGR